MKNEYGISACVMAALTFLFFAVATINEDWSVKLACLIIFPSIVLIISMPCSRISKAIIAKADSIKSRVKRILFYVILPVLSLAVVGIIYIVSSLYEDSRVSTGDFAAELSRAIMFIFTMAVLLIVVLVPYIQTYIVLILRKLNKRKGLDKD